MTKPSRRLIEDWLPIAEPGIESLRERAPLTPFPAPNRLHVWWARRPLVAARVAILASLLPADADRQKFMRVLGIHGDPVAAKKRIAQATRDGARPGAQAYGYARAFSYSPNREELGWIDSELRRANVSESAKVLDPTAGGGAIPFEALRIGQSVVCNDLKPVAALIEKLTFEQPFLNGPEIYSFYQKLGEVFCERVKERLEFLFPPEPQADCRPDGYLFARTIRCPHCGGLIPLAPNWRLAPDGTGVKIIPNAASGEKDRVCSFEIVKSVEEQSEPAIAGGRAACPYPDCRRVISGDTVKSIARAGGMGEQLYAVVYKKRIPTITKSGKSGRDRWERGYRAPGPQDDIFDDIKERLAEKLPLWEAMDIVPTEAIPEGLKTSEPLRYGANYWRDLFSPRQLYCHATGVEVFRELLAEAEKSPDFGEVQKAAFAYLALALDTMLNYGTRSCRWDITTARVRALFDRHDFAMVWTYAEMASLIAGMGYDWAIEKTGKALAELVGLLRPDIDLKKARKNNASLLGAGLAPATAKQEITLSCKSADSLDHIADHSIDAIVMDPPYYDNVMYAELSDFFYVWLKRTAGYVYPRLFTQVLTDKENEAVANPSRYRGQKNPKEHAWASYRDRMAAIFGECRRVLKEDGVLLLMFTHKATGAWDALAKGLIDAGFSIGASWPINTEAEGSLHIRDKAAAKSTIFLACRPRPPKGEETFWEEIEPLVKKAAREKIAGFREAGIGGIDLYLAAFGPALELFSQNWPVARGTPGPKPEVARRSLLEPEFDPYAVTPEDVLGAARAAVRDYSLAQIFDSRRDARLDPAPEWFVLAWHTFRSPPFPFDEALNLARVVGLDIETEAIGKIADKKGSDIIIRDSQERAAKASLGPATGSSGMLDALHHLCHLTRSHSSRAGVEKLRELGLEREIRFRDALIAVLEVLPPASEDFQALEKLRRLAFAESIAMPRQLKLLEKEC